MCVRFAERLDKASKRKSSRRDMACRHRLCTTSYRDAHIDMLFRESLSMGVHEWHNPAGRLDIGDCIDVLNAWTGECPTLIFADPPFNIGETYGTWDDTLSRAEYMDFTYRWIDAAVRVLAPNGSLFVNVPDHVVADIACYLRDDRGL